VFNYKNGRHKELNLLLYTNLPHLRMTKILCNNGADLQDDEIRAVSLARRTFFFPRQIRHRFLNWVASFVVEKVERWNDSMAKAFDHSIEGEKDDGQVAQ